MFRIPACLVLLLCVLSLRSQDLIVTNTGDSLRCVITAVGPYRLAYTQNTAIGKERGRIALKEVSSYKREGYFTVVVGDREGKDRPASPAGNKWTFAAGGGWNYRVSRLAENITAEEKDYVNGLRQGWFADASLHLALSDHWAVGFVYNASFGSRNSRSISVRLPDSSIVSGTMAEDVRIRWVGVNAWHRSAWFGRYRVNSSIGFGPVFYRNYAKLIDDFEINGIDLAMRSGLGVDHRLSDAICIGVELGFLFGSVKEFTLENGSSTYVFGLRETSGEGVHRFDAGIVLRVRL